MISFRTTVIDAFDVKGVPTGKGVGWGRGLTFRPTRPSHFPLILLQEKLSFVSIEGTYTGRCRRSHKETD